MLRCERQFGRSGVRRLWKDYLLIGALTVLQGCRLDIVRIRDGNPIDEKTYETLDVGEATIDETLNQLGAPDEIEYQPGLEEEYLWYKYTDAIDVGLRFRLPTPLPFYQHNFLRLSETNRQRNQLQLVFDDAGILRAKSRQVAAGYSNAAEDERGWRLHIMPRASYSVALIGDGGVQDYNEIFDDGVRVGVDVGLQPTPLFLVFVGGHFQQYQGANERIEGQLASFGNLETIDVHAGVRLTAPVEVLVSFTNFEYLKRLLFDEEMNRPQGLRLYFQGSAGASFSDSVRVKIDGTPAGKFYDRSVQSSGTVETGIEYGWDWGLAFAGLGISRMARFDSGNSPLNGQASTFQALLITGGVSLRF